jgi:hypothetical protein
MSEMATMIERYQDQATFLVVCQSHGRHRSNRGSSPLEVLESLTR